MIPRVRETPDKVEGSKLRHNESPTLNNAIRVLTHIGHKCLVDLDPTKVQPEWYICTHENKWLCKVSWDRYASQGSKPIPFFQFTTRLVRHILATQTTIEPTTVKIWHTHHVRHALINKFW